MADRTITGAPSYINGRIRLPHAKGYYEFVYAGPLPQTPSNLAAIAAKLDRLTALVEALAPGKPPA